MPGQHGSEPCQRLFPRPSTEAEFIGTPVRNDLGHSRSLLHGSVEAFQSIKSFKVHQRRNRASRRPGAASTWRRCGPPHPAVQPTSRPPTGSSLTYVRSPGPVRSAGSSSHTPLPAPSAYVCQPTTVALSRSRSQRACSCPSTTAIAAMFTMSFTSAPRCSTCTGLDKAHQNRTDQLGAPDARQQLVSDVARFEVREDQHVGAAL